MLDNVIRPAHSAPHPVSPAPLPGQPQPAQPPAPTPSRPPSSPSPKARRRDTARSIISTVLVLLLAPVIAVLLTTYVFQSYQVDGQSMQTTLFNNDRLVVWKTTRTWARITGHPYIPARGDIVVFTDANIANFGEDPTKQLIKRVIALPGERLVVANNVVMVYNAEHPNGFDPDLTLPYRRTLRDTAGSIDVIVPAGHVFVMGDNRTDSLDSRMFGAVPANDIIGKLILRVLPVNDTKRF
ncbi:MAG TPA: signal peptidase I [Patescibacteria group bacterium]|nr:signal peptidase I [Patescibacteria group bacterium]